MANLSKFHVVYKRCSNLTGWILRTFTTRETITMMTLFKSLVLSRLDYASQLWSPHLLKSIYLIEKVQRSFTKHITGIKNKPYDERLKLLNLYSVQRRRDRYQIIYLWKIIEGLVPNLSAPITCTYSERRGRLCVVSHVNMCRLGGRRLSRPPIYYTQRVGIGVGWGVSPTPTLCLPFVLLCKVVM